jgi:hypothetical protein
MAKIIVYLRAIEFTFTPKASVREKSTLRVVINRRREGCSPLYFKCILSRRAHTAHIPLYLPIHRT